jgi:hypothetical protein
MQGDDRRGEEGGLMPSKLVLVFAAVFVGLGIALVVQTARAGGGIGYLLGVLFVALGVGRVYLLRSRRARG